MLSTIKEPCPEYHTYSTCAKRSKSSLNNNTDSTNSNWFQIASAYVTMNEVNQIKVQILVCLMINEFSIPAHIYKRNYLFTVSPPSKEGNRLP